MKNHVLYFDSPNQVSIKTEQIPTPKKDQVLIKNILSGISAGTEMLFYSGLMPTELNLDETIPSLKQQFSYPFKYGYCSVGKVVDVGDKKLKHLIDQLVFVFNPHEGYFCVTEEQIIPLPKNLSPSDALFIPNMETAINLVLDGSPLIGENVLVLGLGIVGLLTAALLKQFPLSVLVAMDYHQPRLKMSKELGVDFAFDAAQDNVGLQLKNSLKKSKHKELDLIYELTGNPAALNSAIAYSGYEGRIVLGSWYGRKPCNIDLGGKFHRNRIKVIASQVSTLASELQGRWTKTRRFEVAFDMLAKINTKALISHSFHITQASEAYELLRTHPEEALFVTLTYEE